MRIYNVWNPSPAQLRELYKGRLRIWCSIARWRQWPGGQWGWLWVKDALYPETAVHYLVALPRQMLSIYQVAFHDPFTHAVRRMSGEEFLGEYLTWPVNKGHLAQQREEMGLDAAKDR
jgi:hypothetical protein